jgi:ribosomal protein S7
MTTQENTLMLISKHEEADPIIDSAMEQVAAPRQQDKSSEVYER